MQHVKKVTAAFLFQNIRNTTRAMLVDISPQIPLGGKKNSQGQFCPYEAKSSLLPFQLITVPGLVCARLQYKDFVILVSMIYFCFSLGKNSFHVNCSWYGFRILFYYCCVFSSDPHPARRAAAYQDIWGHPLPRSGGFSPEGCQIQAAIQDKFCLSRATGQEFRKPSPWSRTETLPI